MDITGTNALVAGGASGLGAATARGLAEAGAHVTVADLNEDAGAAVAGEVGGTFVRCDVTDEAHVQAAVEAAGPLRVAVNCAGIGWAQRTAHPKGGVHPLR